MSILDLASAAAETPIAFTPQIIASIIIGLGLPISGIIVALISTRRSKVTAPAAEANRAVHVDERDAHTREVAVILEGYTGVLRATQEALHETRDAAQACTRDNVELQGKYSSLHAEHDELREEFQRSERERQLQLIETIDHFRELESRIPSPPGPPPRPPWARGGV